MLGFTALISFVLPKFMDKEAMEEMQAMNAEKDENGNPIEAAKMPEPPTLKYDTTLVRQRLSEGKT